MRGKIWVRRAALLGGGVLLVSTIYAGSVVVGAERQTPSILARARAPHHATLGPDELDAARRKVLVAVEDPGFYDHAGVDLKTPGAGLTTITQALVKRLYFKDFRPGFSKIRQTLIARFVLDDAVSKSELLLLFANHAYLGHRQGVALYGFAAGAEAYFDRPFRELSQRQYLQLVAMLVAPNRLDPIDHRQANLRRVRRIERLLAGRCAPSGWRDVELRGCASKQTDDIASPG